MKNATKGILLSGLVYPGLGQIMLGRKALGIILISLSSTGLAVYTTALVARTISAFNQIQRMLTDQVMVPVDLPGLYAEVFAPASRLEAAAIPLLIGCWIFSFLHAFFWGRELDRA